MIRVVCLILLCALAPTARAQEVLPRLSVELDAAETIVGQPVILRMKVLVPTWMPSPPDFPALEVPGLLVRLPERASQPVSERIDGETWSGVQRSYRLYPLGAGEFALPQVPVAITYADPDTTQPVQADLDFDPVSFLAQLPQGAKDLNPPLIAQGLSLEQQIEGETDLETGGAIVRVITARINGTTPILIPALTPSAETGALRAYPDDPVIADKEDRGVLSGSRTERVTYVATAPGEAVLPAIKLQWFNLDSNSLETASIPETRVNITGTALDAASTGTLLPIWQIALSLAGLALAGFALHRWARPPLRKIVARERAARRASEGFAHRRVEAAMSAQDLAATYAALTQWGRFYPASDLVSLEPSLTAIGARHYGQMTQEDSAQTRWRALRTAYRSLRTANRRAKTAQAAGTLSPLNPDFTAR